MNVGGVKDGGLCCYDCRGPAPSYMVRHAVWRRAMPDYHELKHVLAERHAGGDVLQRAQAIIELCFPCLEARLKRSLRPEDFNLSIPTNAGIALGYSWTRTP
jgi:hypothetical protein